jgi:hypothetical protein
MVWSTVSMSRITSAIRTDTERTLSAIDRVGRRDLLLGCQQEHAQLFLLEQFHFRSY